MASKEIHFRQDTPKPSHGHQKGQNAHGYHPAVQLESAPGKAGAAGYVQIKKA